MSSSRLGMSGVRNQQQISSCTMSDNLDFQVLIGGLISSASSDYEVQDLLGCGSFGEVAQCRKLATNETVAVKILTTKTLTEEAKEEAEMLKKLKDLDADKFNIVRWNDSFICAGRFCLEFEKLDISLYEFQQRSHSQSLKLAEIRPIVQQLTTALDFLKSAGIIHADLKSENIMMVDHLRQPLKVKVIDFGLAVNNPKAWTGATLQTLWYRSPEVLLGCSINEAIDVWSLGCIAAEMLMGTVLFPASHAYDLMRHIVYTIGKPPDRLLTAGLYTKKFYQVKHAELEPSKWKLKSIVKATFLTCNTRTITSLSDLKKASYRLSGEEASAGESDRESFVDLLRKMLKVDAAERITPSQILQHPFLTMSHLVGTFDNSFYVKMSMELMSICHRLSCGDGEDVAQVTFNTCLIEETSISTASQSDPDEGHPAGQSGREQPFLKSTIISGENSPARKRERDSTDDSLCHNRSPDTPPVKKRRSECLGAALIETSGQISPQKSLLYKRKRDDADICRTTDGTNPAEKRRRVDLKKELADSIKELLSNTDACSSLTPFNKLKKRKRADEEASGSKQKNPSSVNRKREGLDRGEDPKRGSLRCSQNQSDHNKD